MWRDPARILDMLHAARKALEYSVGLGHVRKSMSSFRQKGDRMSQILCPQMRKIADWVKKRKRKCHHFTQKAIKANGKKESRSFGGLHLQMVGDKLILGQ